MTRSALTCRISTWTARLAQLAFAAVLTGAILASSVPAAGASTAVAGPCRFGITAPLGSQGYDLASLGVGSYLDWTADSHPVLPPGVEYIRVLSVSDGSYPGVLASLPALVQSNPGAVWLVGNEPDTSYGQDNLVAEVYADRFYEIATLARANDSTARLGFGTIVQPTPIRLRYLDKAWDRLVARAGSPEAASALVDIWSIHSFILNEQPKLNEQSPPPWGTGIPPGFENDYADAIIITDFADTHSNTIFVKRVQDFRIWLAAKGERNKPVWITEYGSLFPSTIPQLGVPDSATISFMLGTFNFLLGAQDAATGLPSDGNRLVQRWFWYSLNDHRDNFGGSLFDPDNNRQITAVGQAFVTYVNPAPVNQDLYPVSVIAAPLGFAADGLHANYRLLVQVDNRQSPNSEASYRIKVYDGDPANSGTLISRPDDQCSDGSMAAFDWKNVHPESQHTLYVSVSPIGREDLNPQDNQAFFEVTPGIPHLSFLPSVMK